jgi:hypothetical protein
VVNFGKEEDVRAVSGGELVDVRDEAVKVSGDKVDEMLGIGECCGLGLRE